jgi:Uma2 family endonuclease
LYREAGVREYWIVNPETNKITAYYFKDGEIFTGIYGKTGTARVSIFPDLNIELEQVFAE